MNTNRPLVVPDLTFIALQHAVNQRSHEIDPRDALGLLFFSNEMGGECGEAQNVVKKLVREELGISGSRATDSQLGDELADLIITACNVARYRSIDLGACITRKFNYTSDQRKLQTHLPE